MFVCLFVDVMPINPEDLEEMSEALQQQKFVHPHSDHVSVLGPREVVCVV